MPCPPSPKTIVNYPVPPPPPPPLPRLLPLRLVPVSMADKIARCPASANAGTARAIPALFLARPVNSAGDVNTANVPLALLTVSRGLSLPPPLSFPPPLPTPRWFHLLPRGSIPSRLLRHVTRRSSVLPFFAALSSLPPFVIRHQVAPTSLSRSPARRFYSTLRPPALRFFLLHFVLRSPFRPLRSELLPMVTRTSRIAHSAAGKKDSARTHRAGRVD